MNTPSSIEQFRAFVDLFLRQDKKLSGSAISEP
jgi:hypothetical protein